MTEIVRNNQPTRAQRIAAHAVRYVSAALFACSPFGVFLFFYALWKLDDPASRTFLLYQVPVWAATFAGLLYITRDAMKPVEPEIDAEFEEDDDGFCAEHSETIANLRRELKFKDDEIEGLRNTIDAMLEDGTTPPTPNERYRVPFGIAGTTISPGHAPTQLDAFEAIQKARRDEEEGARAEKSS